MENYSVVVSSDLVDLITRVNKCLAMGYLLSGGMCSYNGNYYQAIYKNII